MDVRVDHYLASLEEPKRTTLTQLREMIVELIPDAEECISYGLPAYRVGGTTIAGFAAFTRHLSYLPHSGSVLSKLGAELIEFRATKSSLHFPVDQPLPRHLVETLLTTRMAEAGLLPRSRGET